MNYNKIAGVSKLEIDATDILVPTGISVGGIVVRSVTGKINKPILVTSNKEYIEQFGIPIYTSGASSDTALTALGITSTGDRSRIPNFGYSSYSALEFLKESSQLICVRGWSTTDYYANAWVAQDLTTSALTSAETRSYSSVAPAASYAEFDRDDAIQALDNFTTSASAALNIFANTPSVYGNDIAVTVEPFSVWSDWRYSYDTYPSNAVAASAMTYASISADTYYPIASKVFKISVFVKQSNYITPTSWDDYIDRSGRVGYGMDSSLSATSAVAANTASYRLTPVEVFYGSLDSRIDSEGNDLWIESVINGNSNYVYVKTNPTISTFSYVDDYNEVPNKRDNSGEFVYTNHLVKLQNGTTTQSTGIGSLAGWSGFEDRNVNVSILINTDPSPAVKQEIGRIVAKRLDCVGVNQVEPFNKISRDTVKNSESYGYTSPSYIGLYSGYSRVYDQYNRKYVYLPNAMYAASVYARVDRISNPWTAPAGNNYGVLPVIDQYKNWTDNDIIELLAKNINCVRKSRGYGLSLWSQKTAQLKESALSRMNVRRLMLYIENNIEVFLNNFLFEPNTDKTRLRVYSVVDEFLKGVYAGQGIQSWKVICDDTNNTADTMARNELHVEIRVQPVYTIEFIKLTAVITKSDVSLVETLI